MTDGIVAATDQRFPFSTYVGVAIRVLGVSAHDAWRMSPREIHFLVSASSRDVGREPPSPERLRELLQLPVSQTEKKENRDG